MTSTGVLETWVVDAWKEKTRQKEYGFLFSRAETAANLASMVGGLIGGLVAVFSLQLPFLLGGVVFLSTWAMSLFLLEEKTSIKKIKINQIITKSLEIIKQGTKESIKNSQVLSVALYAGLTMIGIKALDMFWSKRFVDMASGKVWVTGYIWVLVSLFMILGNLALKSWTDKQKGYIKGIMVYTIMAGLAIFLSALSQNFYLAIFFFLIYEISRGIHRPALFGYFNKIIPSQKRATILSFTITLTWAGSALGLLILGWVAKKYSIEASWLTASLIILLSLIPVFKLKTSY